MRKIRNSFKRAYIIPHGKSEYAIVDFVKRTLRLPVEIYPSYQQGKGVQITDINSLLSSRIFKPNELKKIRL